ncbi:endoribonuclease L-PSP [Ammonifex degensii KC4]|uniref:Endoribonuclease L-PSP n=1 Tax=Ammonifex degensii (strain DSM 10501 / KC4) TaxID=429009 RepID=C9RAK7_AMMDK|nr:RidA family protein [Ammonifex degensii]ACX51284.1 endoribonuclease L-PSP [Ammonifex degensii KC4]
MKRERIVAPNAPSAIGPYSQAVRVGSLVFVSGQVPLDPSTGQLVEGDIGTQTERAIQNIEAILEAAGLGLKNVVKTTVFLTDINEFPVVNEVYARYFGDSLPARSAVQVAGLPKGARVEIEAIAWDPGHGKEGVAGKTSQ